MARRTGEDIAGALDKGVRVLFIHGDTSLLVDRAVAEAEAWGVERCGLPAFNHGRWRATDDRAEDALVTARTMPMMADLRVVVLRDLHQAKNDLAEATVEYMKEASPSTVFIAVAGAFGKPRKGQKRWGQRLANAAKASGLVITRDSKGVNRMAFAREHAESLGLELGRREAELLVELVGDDIGRMAQELDKVATFLGGSGTITGEALTEVCSAVAQEDIWELTRGIARRDPDLAVRALHRLLSDGQAEHYLLAMIAMQLRKVLQASQMLVRGASPDQVKRAVWLKPDELAEVQAMARRGGGPDAADTLERVAAANREMNRSTAGSRRVLEALVLELCA